MSANTLPADLDRLHSEITKLTTMVQILTQQRDSLIAAIGQLAVREVRPSGDGMNQLEHEAGVRFGASIPQLIRDVLQAEPDGLPVSEIRQRVSLLAGPRRNLANAVNTALHRMCRRGVLERLDGSGHYRLTNT